MSGKGSAPRPFSVSADEYGSRWDQIFRKDAGAKDGPTIQPEALVGDSDKESKEINDGARGQA